MSKFNQIKIQNYNALLMQLLDKMESIKDSAFYYDQETSERVNIDCKKNSVPDNIHHAIFKTDSDELYSAIVFVRVQDNNLEVFDIKSSNPNFSKLSAEQFNIVIDYFYKHAISPYIDNSYKVSIVEVK